MLLGVLTCGLTASSLCAFQTKAGIPPRAGAGEGCASGNCRDGTDACYATCSTTVDWAGKYYRYLPRYVETCINTNQPPCLTIQGHSRRYNDSACTVVYDGWDVDKLGCRFPNPDE
jgi:hypothetical protein